MASPRDGQLVSFNDIRYTVVPERITWRTVPTGRDGVDQGAGAGEQALSNQNVWRRSREDWIEGAGQVNADLLDPDESSRLRFRESVGINPWVRRELSLHKTTTKKYTPAGAGNTINAVVATAANGTEWMFVVDNGAAFASSNPDAASPTWAAITNPNTTPANDPLVNVQSITTDGNRVWFAVAYPSPSVTLDGIYYVDAGSVTGIQLGDTAPATGALIGYAAGRLLFCNGGFVLLEIVNGGLDTAVVFEHPSTNFSWDGIASSPAGIYVWGHVGGKSEVYVTTAVDGTGELDVPFHACTLPDGETLNIMCFYLGVMVLGTSKGCRLAVITGGGFLSFGPLFAVPTHCLEPQGEDVWFGWTLANPAGTQAGLGRMRLSRFTSELVPAWASDLLCPPGDNGAVQSVVTFEDRRYFTVAGEGVFGESASTYLSTGTIDLGWFTYGIPENKLVDGAQLWTDALPASTSVDLDVYADDNTSTKVVDATYDDDGARTENFRATAQTKAERYRVVLTLATSNTATTPVVKRVTLRVVPKPFVSQAITLPLLIADEVKSDTSGTYGLDPYENFVALETALKERTTATLTIGDWSAEARLEALEAGQGDPSSGIDGWDDRQRFLSGEFYASFLTVQDED